MNRLTRALSRITLAACVIAMKFSIAQAASPLFMLCSWPVESAGEGILNVATQDTLTTYWFMPINTSAASAILIKGTYPKARLFNFASYDDKGVLIDTISDSDLAPDPGSTNPFATPTASGRSTYTLRLSNGQGGAANTLGLGTSPLASIVYRVIVPDQGLDKSGGVGVPAIQLVASNGRVRQLQPCPFASPESSFGNMIPILAASGFSNAAAYLQQVLSIANLRTAPLPSCTSSQASPAAVPFGPAPGTSFFPNPPTLYLQTPNICSGPDTVVVIRGKALVYPNTYYGGSVFDPAFDGQVQARYWSMCNNDGVLPYPVIGCQADYQTKLDQGGSYTYVVTRDPAPPSWLPAYATWLPWGPTNVPITLIFRAILPSAGSQLPADAVPTAAICDQRTFIAGGC